MRRQSIESNKFFLTWEIQTIQELAEQPLISDDPNLKKGTGQDAHNHHYQQQQQSAYILRLVKENERLKRHWQQQQQPTTPDHSRLGQSRSCEDIRRAVEASHQHLVMHNACVQNQVHHIVHHDDHRRSLKGLAAQQDQICALSNHLNQLSEENRDLKRRIGELTMVRQQQRENIEELNRKQKILIGDHGRKQDEVNKVRKWSYQCFLPVFYVSESKANES